MATKYYVTVNKEGVEKETSKYDLITTRKADYTKFAKNELKNGADSVDVHASYTLPILRSADPPGSRSAAEDRGQGH